MYIYICMFMLNLTHRFGVSSVTKNYFNLLQLFKNVKTVLRFSASQQLEEDGTWLHVIISFTYANE